MRGGFLRGVVGEIRREVMGEWGGGGVSWGFHNWWWWKGGWKGER